MIEAFLLDGNNMRPFLFIKLQLTMGTANKQTKNVSYHLKTKPTAC